MLVDDSAIIRGLMKRMIDPQADIEVAASVSNGELAVKKLQQESFDVIILDIEMPVMDGLTALPKLIEADPGIVIVMASTLTLKNAEISMKAMELGATDYVAKPTSTGEIGGAGDFQRELLEKIRSLGRRRLLRPGRPKGTAAPGARRAALHSAPVSVGPKSFSLRPTSARQRPEVLAIGSSTGGPQALMNLLKGLSPRVDVPIVITQHMPATFTTILAEHLGKATGRPSAEAKDGDFLERGRIYVAPGDYHMTISQKGVQKQLHLSQDPPENFCRPAVDPMLRSVATVFGARCLVTILTGMGADGTKGGKAVVDAGGTVIAQDEQSSVVWGMPGAAAAAGICSAVLPLDKMSQYINDFMVKGAA